MPRFTEEDLKVSIQKSFTFAEVLRNFGMCETGNNYITLEKYIKLWKISIEHFSTASERAKKYLNKPQQPLNSILIRNSSNSRTNLKKRLYEEGLKKPVCEMCGQNEFWHGKKLSLILDHKNGIRNDNRLENLRILCPNCNATLETHCGKQVKNKCAGYSKLKPLKRKYCSIECYRKHGTQRLLPTLRKVERPNFEVLISEVKKYGFLATGRNMALAIMQSENGFAFIKNTENN